MTERSHGFDAESRTEGTPHFQGSGSTKRRRLVRHDAEPRVSSNGPEEQAVALAAGENAVARAAYESFAETMRSQLAPGDMLESLLADRVILSAWRVRSAMRAEEVWTLSEAADQGSPTTARLGCDPLNALRRDSRRAQTSLRGAMRDLDRYRARRSPAWGKAGKTDPRDFPRPVFDQEPDARPATISSGNEWPVLPDSPMLPPPHLAMGDAEVPVRHDRLVFDFKISEFSPVVKGTWVTVNHLVSLIVDGWTWADILRDHPELTEEDIRACLAFAVEEEHFGR